MWNRPKVLGPGRVEQLSEVEHQVETRRLACCLNAHSREEWGRGSDFTNFREELVLLLVGVEHAGGS